MSNLWFNIRFGTYHLQLDKEWGVRWSYNQAHIKEKRSNHWKWFAIYCAFGKHFV